MWGRKDTEMSDIAYQALKDKLPLEQWSFMLLNFDQTNGQGCQDLANKIATKGIKVKQTIQADCTNKQEVNQVLATILNYLTNNIDKLDQEYKSASDNSLQKLYSDIKTKLSDASNTLKEYEDGMSEYNDRHNIFMENLFNQVEGLRKRLREEPKKTDDQFQAQVNSAINKCNHDTGIASVSELESMKNRHGSYSTPYAKGVHQMRSHLLKHFHPIELGLKESLERKKTEVVSVLIDLGLGELSQKRNSEFLTDLAQKIPSSAPNLKLAFEFISSFEFLYKGVVQSMIWNTISEQLPCKLDDPDINESSPDIQTIFIDLKTRHQEAIENCKKKLDSLESQLSDVGLSMVEEFADHILRSANIEKEWNNFLYQNRTLIWGELKELEERKHVIEEWLKLIDETASMI